MDINSQWLAMRLSESRVLLAAIQKQVMNGLLVGLTINTRFAAPGGGPCTGGSGCGAHTWPTWHGQDHSRRGAHSARGAARLQG